MAEDPDKIADSAEKAYAAAAEAVQAKPAPAKETAKADMKKTAKPAAKPKPAAKKPAPKAVAKPKPKPKAAPKPATPKKAAAAKPAPAKAAKVVDTAQAKATATAEKAAKPAPAKPKTEQTPVSNPISQSKEPTMAKTTDFTKTMTDAMSEIQDRAKEAYEQTSGMAGEASEFTKGNVEAMVESGKILSSGVQDMSKTYIDEAKSAFETMTADMKEMAAVKSPTELFQIQGKLMRRNFDSMVAFGSKSSEAMVKLANDTMAPLSGRMSMAADKVAKATT